ncbi:MAG TPA: ATP synthase F0 subunit C [Candidatus Omnitrophota bacterium]|nr:ATP synthase F0 subunit C [Candidatus Omnitrophota bacterium]HPT07949.1 ATP synthase F0 subunit C [Candidatus Omnitrophota bacterium]
MSRNLTIIIIFALCILGPSAVFALSSYASISALGRNPSSAPKIFTGMIISLVFAQTLAIIAMLIVFQLLTAG